jgi:hypothetical protein
VDTGINNQFAYGHYTRRVMTSRKGKEGNDAFLHDSIITHRLQSYDGINLSNHDTSLHFLNFLNIS